MDRRKFLGLSVLSSLTSGIGLMHRHPAFAQTMGTPSTEPYTGKFYLFINAGGGWDPTMVCDPKGGTINMQFRADQIRSAGNIRYAPITYTTENGYTNQQFFEKFQNRLLILNGVDMETNNHDSGTRFTWSGHLEDGYPPLAALIAAALAPGKPLGFLSNGGYENTQGVVPLTRLNNLNTIRQIAYPNRPNTDSMVGYHSAATYQRIQRFQNERLAAISAAQTLPTFQNSMRQLLATRAGGNLLERLIQFLPSDADINRSNNQIYRQGLVALAAYQAGVSAAANLEVGGFDTHGDHDNQQGSALGRLLRGVDQLMDRIDMMGLQDRVVVMVGSDFGRTPQYNEQRGKDHWSVTSMMLMGAGIEGNRVLGASTDTQRARNFDYGSLTPTDTGTSRLSPKAIHMGLRRFAGIENSPFARQFPIYYNQTLNFSR